MNLNETKVYVLGFCVGFVAARSFCAGIFRYSDQAFGNGVFSLELFLCTLKTSKWQPAKMRSFHQRKRSDNKQYAMRI